MRSSRPRFRRLAAAGGALLLGAAGAVLTGVAPAAALTYTVTSAADAGAGTLRQAILDANANAGPDVIKFAPALSGTTITIASTLAITEELAIDGTAADGTTPLGITIAHGVGTFRLLDVAPIADGQDFTLRHLTLLGDGVNRGTGLRYDPVGAGGGSVLLERVEIAGFLGDDNEPGGGASIWQAEVDIVSSLFSDNASDDGWNGGGVSVGGSSDVDVINTRFERNSGASGGAFNGANIASLFFNGSSFTENSATTDGGGINVSNISGDVVIYGATFDSNTAAEAGGGLASDTTGPLTVQDSTFDGNTAGTTGGGIVIDHVFNDTWVHGTSFLNNVAGTGGAGLHVPNQVPDPQNSPADGRLRVSASTFSGGTLTEAGATGVGIRIDRLDGDFDLISSTLDEADAPVAVQVSDVMPSGTFVLRNSTIVGVGGVVAATAGGTGEIANSIVDGGAAADIEKSGAGAVEVRNSLLTQPVPAAVVDGGGNVIAADPGLQPLADNGGRTWTRLPLTTSPAVDAGEDPFAEPGVLVDQRDLPRLVGVLDIGAVERQADDPADPVDPIEPAGPALPPTGSDLTGGLLLATVFSLLGAGMLLRRRFALPTSR